MKTLLIVFAILLWPLTTWADTIKAYQQVGYQFEALDEDGNLLSHTLEVKINGSNWTLLSTVPTTIDGVTVHSLNGQGQDEIGTWSAANALTLVAPDGSTVPVGTAALGRFGSRKAIALTAVVTGHVQIRATQMDGDGASNSQILDLTVGPGDQSVPTLAGASMVVYGNPLILTPAGGQSTGAYVYTVTGAPGGSVANDRYSAANIGQATITVCKQADETYAQSPQSQPLLVDVTQRPITLSATVQDKAYDGTTAVNATVTASGKLDGDDVVLVPGTATAASANAGTQVVVFSGFSLSGADASKYLLEGQPSGQLTITPVAPVGHFTGTVVQTGSPLPLNATWTGVGGETLGASTSYTVNGNSVTSSTILPMGEYDVVAHYAATQNYTTVSVTAHFSVAGESKIEVVLGNETLASDTPPIPDLTDLGWVEMGQSKSAAFTIKNVGTIKAVVAPVTLTGPFAGTLSGGEIEPGQTQTQNLTFMENSVQNVFSKLSIGDYIVNFHAYTYLPISSGSDLKGQNIITDSKPVIAIRVVNEAGENVGPMIPSITVTGPFTYSAKVIDAITLSDHGAYTEGIEITPGEALIVTVTATGKGTGVVTITPKYLDPIVVPVHSN